ncbi:MAG: MtrB/PioB family decaheme-associated outer membrane protein [Gammaproteobacteria bacterium]|nr:MAG: MtrB/PioB family decaheme-associated outer membrane protein [Gammaproteobacteria bacterium]
MIVRASTFVALLSLMSAGALAEQADTAGWSCTLCDQGRGWDLDLGLAPAYVADDAFRFGDYSGMDEEGVYLTGDVAANYVDERARYLRLDGFTSSPDFTGLFLSTGRQGAWEFRGAYQAIPRRFFDTTMTPYSGNGSGILTLPEDWVRAPTTELMTSLDDNLTPVEIERDLDLWKLGATIKPSARWRVDVDYRRQEKKGVNLGSGSVLYSAAELARPIDYTTDDLELAFRFNGEGWETSLSYLGSYFDNGEETLTWENAFSSGLGTDAGSKTLAPDNELHQLSLAGAMRLPKRTVLSGQLAVGRLSQDEVLAPYTINPSIPTQPLPTLSADAEADTLNLNLRAVTSPWRRVTLEGEVRFNEFDNRTDVNDYQYVITDAVPAFQTAANPTYDYERTELKLRGEYRPGRRLKLHLGYDGRRFERSAQERRKTQTDKLWFRLHRRLGADADLDFDLFVENRDGSSYEALDRAVSEQNPLMRKYNLSDRERYGLRLKGSVYPAERWDFGWELEYGEDDYKETAVGLTRTKYARAGLDASWLLGSKGVLFGALSTEVVDADQAASQAFDVPDWAATTSDRFDSASIGFEHPALLGPAGLELAYSWSNGRGEIRKNTSGVASSFPDLTSRRHRFDLGVTYPVGDAWTLGFNYLFEKVRSDDWSLAGVDPSTVSNLLSMGADPFDYEVNVVYVSFRYLRPAR